MSSAHELKKKMAEKERSTFFAFTSLTNERFICVWNRHGNVIIRSRT